MNKSKDNYGSQRGTKDEQWEIIRKEYLPNHVMVFPSTGGHSYTHAVGHYRILEQNINTQEIRDRIITTEPIYLHEHLEIQTAFQVAIIGLKEIEGAIKINEKD